MAVAQQAEILRLAGTLERLSGRQGISTEDLADLRKAARALMALSTAEVSPAVQKAMDRFWSRYDEVGAVNLQRLQRLARRGAWYKHQHAITYGDNNHTSDEVDNGFLTCKHADCVLVRE